MTSVPEAGISRTGLCWFAMQRLPPLLAAFTKEIDGVLAAEDIEYIHRMRVASRRLRAALPLFRPCFPPKQYSRWMRTIAMVTRALGDARDTDVQVAFLLKFRKKQATRRETSRAADTMEPALDFLLQELREKRQQLQGRVVSALSALEKSGAIAEMNTAFSSLSVPGGRTPVRALAYGIPTIAALRIESRLAAMRSFESWVPHADAVAEHHAMRIAAKKLRYTMETYGPVYRLSLGKTHARVKKIQEILGDLHDCDVWIDHVTLLLLRERGRLRLPERGKRPDTATLAGLRLFLKDREQNRILLHRRFMRYWQSLDNRRIWDALETTLINGRKKRYVPARKTREPEIRAACEAIGAGHPDDLPHLQQVTRIALALFDALGPLHGLAGTDRCLLGCAGMLHDAGGTRKERRRNSRSAQGIFSDERLPLDITERSIVGLIVLGHRGKATPESHPLFRLLDEDSKKRVLILTAILRIAAGLDYSGSGAVQEVRCTLAGNEVTCDVAALADISREKERARKRSQLFTRVFGRELVIP